MVEITQIAAALGETATRVHGPGDTSMFNVLVTSVVRNLEFLTFTGLTLDSAMPKATDLSLVTAQQARLSCADFSGS